MLCEDFEQASGTAPAGWQAAGLTMISNERSYSGSQALKVNARGSGYNRNVISYKLDQRPEFQKAHYGRMMFWLDKPEGQAGDFTFVQAEGKPKVASGAPAQTNVMYRYRVQGRGPGDRLMSNYDTWLDNNSDGQTDWLTDCALTSEFTMPHETWSCLEWHFDAEADQLEYWLNGERIDDIGMLGGGGQCLNPQTQGSMWYGPERFEQVFVGFEQYHGDAKARHAYIDDVVLSSSQIGCGDFEPGEPEPSPEPTPSMMPQPSPTPSAIPSPVPSAMPTAPPGGGSDGPGVLFSMDFEGESLDTVPAGWHSFVGYVPNGNNNRNGNTYALVDNQQARSGSMALKVGGNGPAQIVKRLPENPGEIYMRAWFYMDIAIGSDASDNHEHMMGVKQYEGGADNSSFSANNEARIGQGKGHLGFNVVPNSDAISPTMERWYSGPTTPVNEWYCIEAHLNPLSTSGGYDSMVMYLNGEEVNAVRSASDWHVDSVSANWLADKMGYAMFGWHSFSNHSVEMWVDDIVVSTQAIGCN